MELAESTSLQGFGRITATNESQRTRQNQFCYMLLIVKSQLMYEANPANILVRMGFLNTAILQKNWANTATLQKIGECRIKPFQGHYSA